MPDAATGFVIGHLFELRRAARRDLARDGHFARIDERTALSLGWSVLFHVAS